MASSFAAYASQYLNKKQNGANSTISTEQPMFFSFTTDGDGGDGSRHHHRHTAEELDDLDDPHLRASGMGTSSVAEMYEQDEDPYLNLDEHQQPSRMTRAEQQSVPLMARSGLQASGMPESPPGWLAHLAQSPRRTPSPPSSSTSDEDSSPPADLMAAQQPQGRSIHQNQHRMQRPPTPPQTAHSLSLTESLLPNDGVSRPVDVFSLPDPRVYARSKRRKHHDAPWISVYLSLVSVCVFFSILLLFITKRPPSKEVPSVLLPYTVLLRTVPLMIILTLLSAVCAYVHVYLLRLFVKPVMVATSLFVPATLFISAIWAFVGSFMWEEGQVPTWGETVGLRLFAIIPLVLSIITARRLLHLPRQIHTTSSTLVLSTHILINNLFLLALSPAILLVMFIGSIPFVTLIFRLLLVGYASNAQKGGGVEWHVKSYANWAIAGAMVVWYWSWAVARGLLRMNTASVVGAWYFADPAAPIPPPTSTHTIHAALLRSTGPSLGSIILASLILTVLRILTLTSLLLRRLSPLLLQIPWVPLSVPIAMYIVPGIGWLTFWLEEKASRVSRYALVYAGLTGKSFWESATRGREIVGGVEGGGVILEEEDEEAQLPRQGRKDRRKGRQQGQTPKSTLKKRKFSSEPPLALLTISPLTLSFPFALLTYLFVAHTLGAPNEALGAALLAGGVTSLVGLFCVGLVRDTADTLYLCYCIDKTSGEKHREEVFIAFEYDFSSPSGPASNSHPAAAGSQSVAGSRSLPRGQPSFKSKETLFDAVQEESSDEEDVRTAYARGVVPSGSKPRSSEHATPAAATRKPLEPYVHPDDEAGEEVPDEDLDPFRRSIVDDEEAQVSPRRVSHQLPPTVVQRPSFSGVARATQDRQRMLSSTQELNMKSQFLMNMRGYGEESQASASQSQSRSRREEEYSDEEEDEQEDEEEDGGVGMMPGSAVSGGSGNGRTQMGISRSYGQQQQQHHSQHQGQEDDDEMLGPGSDFFS